MDDACECPLCGLQLRLFAYRERNQHVNECSGQSNATNDQGNESTSELDEEAACMLCGLNLSHLSIEQRMRHINLCLDQQREQIAMEQQKKARTKKRDSVLVLDGASGALTLEADSGNNGGRDRRFGDSILNAWLTALGLKRYARIFAEERIDMNTLRLCKETDLESMRIPKAARRRIIDALPTWAVFNAFMSRGRDYAAIDIGWADSDETTVVLTQEFGTSSLGLQSFGISGISRLSVLERGDSDLRLDHSSDKENHNSDRQVPLERTNIMFGTAAIKLDLESEHPGEMENVRTKWSSENPEVSSLRPTVTIGIGDSPIDIDASDALPVRKAPELHPESKDGSVLEKTRTSSSEPLVIVAIHGSPIDVDTLKTPPVSIKLVKNGETKGKEPGDDLDHEDMVLTQLLETPAVLKAASNARRALNLNPPADAKKNMVAAGATRKKKSSGNLVCRATQSASLVYPPSPGDPQPADTRKNKKSLDTVIEEENEQHKKRRKELLAALKEEKKRHDQALETLRQEYGYLPPSHNSILVDSTPPLEEECDDDDHDGRDDEEEQDDGVRTSQPTNIYLAHHKAGKPIKLRGACDEKKQHVITPAIRKLGPLYYSMLLGRIVDINQVIAGVARDEETPLDVGYRTMDEYLRSQGMLFFDPTRENQFGRNKQRK